jgi:NAD(P)-dependent dehydrogenase (short-subunit alcohol dehydrogenase family)
MKEPVMADPTGLIAGKTVLVTGGTGGTGGIVRATAAGLAATGARVGTVGRDRNPTRAAAADIAAISVAPGTQLPSSMRIGGRQ